MTPKIVALDGFASRLFPGVNLARDLAEFDPVSVTSATGLNAWPAWLDGRIDKQLPPGPFIAVGFSAGATAAARLAERNAKCVGLVFVSGLAWEPSGASRRYLPSDYIEEMLRAWWQDFPALCLATQGEKRQLVRGTENTMYALRDAGADVGDWRNWEPAPNPDATSTRPHLLGVGHHLPEIRGWLNKHFGKETHE